MPFGAVKTDENVTITLLVHNSVSPQAVKILIRNNENFRKEIYMDCNGQNSEHIIYICNFSLNIPDIYFYRFEITINNKVIFCGSVDGALKTGDWLPEWQLTVYDKNFTTPDWVKGEIMYQIFPDRFARSSAFEPLPAKNKRIINDDWYAEPDSPHLNENYKADDFFCGNLNGIIERLDYLKSLGVGIIYLNPIFESPENHRYSTADYKNIDPYLGTNEIFAELVKACSEKGIKIILDGVFSHTGADSIYFNKFSNYQSHGAYQGEGSPFYKWYNFIDFPDKYECWWGFENLPNVNELDVGYLDFITSKDEGILNFWQRRGTYGYRLDVADELPDEFLDKLRVCVKSYDDDAFIIGEVWEDASNKTSYGNMRKYLLGSQLDSVMNYPWRCAIIEFVLDGNAQKFKNRIMCILENYPKCVLNSLMNILSTHDTNRIITTLGVQREVSREERAVYQLSQSEYELGKKRFKIASFMQFTLPGIPSVYYGDEAGMTGFEDPFCRKCFPYGREDLDLTEYIKRLAKMRRDYKNHFCEEFKFIFIGEGIAVYKRGDIRCFINAGGKPQFVEAADLACIAFQEGDVALIEGGVILSPGSVCAVYKEES